MPREVTFISCARLKVKAVGGDPLDVYDFWRSAGGEEDRFLAGWLLWDSPLFKPTVEGLSAYFAYRSLPRELGLRYAVFSSHLFDVFFSLSEEELAFVERNLPPYPYIGEVVWRGRSLSDEEMSILRERVPKNPFRALKLLREKERILEEHGLMPEEYRLILERQRVEDWRALGKVLAVFYGVSAFQVFLSTMSVWAVLAYLLSFPLPYLGLRYLPPGRVQRYVDRVLTLYAFASSPLGALRGYFEYGVLAPLLARLVERFWFSSRFPDAFRRVVYSLQLSVSGLKRGRFDEREVREKLYGLRVDSPGVPRSALERFREEIDNGVIEVVDPRSALLHPWALSWFRRRVVAVQEGRTVRVVDKGFVRKLAEKEGLTLGEMEERVRRMPLKYLGFDFWDGKIAYTRDIIAVLPCELVDALAFKEGYTAVLGKKADEIAERKLLIGDPIVEKLSAWKSARDPSAVGALTKERKSSTTRRWGDYAWRARLSSR